MRQFNVLDRHLSLKQHYLLEASAGTGKTFSIQNIVCRLLIEPDNTEDTLLADILVVTFTRASTRDLKQRIRNNLTQTLHRLTHWLRDGMIDSEMPDFLLAYIEQGTRAVEKACKRLKRALFTFDQAQIFTIHGFCRRMLLQHALESDLGLNVSTAENSLPANEIEEIIKNFFRTEVNRDNYTAGQLQIVLKNDPDHRVLSNLILSPVDLDSQPTLVELFDSFCSAMSELKDTLSLNSTAMIEDFIAQQKYYRKQKTSKNVAEIFEAATRFAKLFGHNNWTYADLDMLIHDEIVWAKAFNESLSKGKKIDEALHYPSLTHSLVKQLVPIIEKAGDFPHLIARMAIDCRKLYRRHLEEEEKLGPDDILRKMKDALHNENFVNKIRETFSAAIIDEFQDTDPLQWEIFYTLFLSNHSKWNGSLYLVGDPKQSIYSFRQADIYTYLDAKQKIGENNRLSLAVNYRSSPRLVEALNLLFSQEYTPDMFTLPQMNTAILYQPVQAALNHSVISDGRGAVHFIIADVAKLEKEKPSLSRLEKEIYFPFIVHEIIHLKKTAGYADKDFAVLVKDHYQAKRIAQYLSEYHISVHLQKGKSLADSSMHAALIALLQAVIKPHNRGFVRTALSTPLLRWTEDDLHNLPTLEFPLLLMRKWKHTLFSEGFLSFIQDVLNSAAFPTSSSVKEKLLSSVNGLELYRDLLQIVNVITDHHLIEWHTPDEIIPFLDGFHEWKKNDDPRIKQVSDPDANGVEIMTLHYSKGLEFSIVFALGLINPSEVRELLIPIKVHDRVMMKVIPEESQTYIDYCEERDGEKIRQLYVAMTRAKDRLYVPASIGQKKRLTRWGAASPIDLFLARLCKVPANYTELYERIRNGTGEDFIQFLDTAASTAHITYSIHSEPIVDSLIENSCKQNTLPLKPPPAVSISYQPLFLSSFSSLQHRQSVRSEDVLSSPKDYFLPEKTVHTLPANQDTGLLAHLILEKIDYTAFRSLKTAEEALWIVTPFLKGTSLEEWNVPMTEMIYQALCTSLDPIDLSFCFANIGNNSLYREMDFTYTFKPESFAGNALIQEGLLKGVVDLIIIYDNLYYIVDWKTNWLGPDSSYYDSTAIHNAMIEHNYYLQSAIYAEALKRYLKIVESRPFEICFGGVFYLFIRGLKKGQQSGITHFFPEGYG